MAINIVAIEIGSRSMFQYVNDPSTPKLIDKMERVDETIVVIEGVKVVSTSAITTNANITVDFVTGTIVSSWNNSLYLYLF